MIIINIISSIQLGDRTKTNKLIRLIWIVYAQVIRYKSVTQDLWIALVELGSELFCSLWFCVFNKNVKQCKRGTITCYIKSWSMFCSQKTPSSLINTHYLIGNQAESFVSCQNVSICGRCTGTFDHYIHIIRSQFIRK